MSRYLHRRAKLTLAAIDDDQIRQRELLVAPAGQVSGKDLLNRGIVVLLAHSLDLELPIFALPRPTGLEPNQGSHRISALVM